MTLNDTLIRQLEHRSNDCPYVHHLIRGLRVTDNHGEILVAAILTMSATIGGQQKAIETLAANMTNVIP